MNRADAMLKALQSELVVAWLPRDIIFASAGRFFLTNNAASELRARGYDVEHRVINGKHHYRLTSSARGNHALSHLTDSLEESGAAVVPSSASPEQLSLVAA